MSAEKKFSLNLPLKVILTEEGASHFISHKIKLLRFRLADNIEEYGISLNPFSPQSLQNMILVNYISKIEISMSEFVSVRQEVMDLSKVVVYSLLYKQFDRQLFADFIQTDAVQKHNRKNPTQLIDERTKMSENQLRQILASQKATVQLAKKEILDPVWKSLMENKDYSLEEKNIYLLMTEKFLNRLSLMNWYIITKFYRTEGFSQINIAIRHLLQVYMEKSRVAEYISILVMELALNSENTNMRKEAKRMFAGIEDVDALIYDPEQREKIVAELKRNHEQVFISWKLGGGSSAIGKQGRLQITLYNKDDEFQEVKENIESKASADTNKKSLIDFYRQMPDGQEGTDLGLYYLSYLEDACKKVNIKFESIVNQSSSSDLTVINLKFNF